MKTLYPFILYLAAALSFAACDDKPGGDTPDPPAASSYLNPVSDMRLPDPSVIQGDDGAVYIIASDEQYKGLPIVKSTDLVTWTKVGEVFAATNRPRFDGRTDGGLWAPDIVKIGGKYVLYYSYYSTLGEWQWGIGVATADRPTGPWTDKGKLFLGGEIGVRCSIDPFCWSEGGSNWLVWGSYYGIWAVELSADGLSLKGEKTRLAGTDGYGLEGSMIHKKDGKYYLFVSEGGTGYNEHYKLGADRADSFLGPYLNKAGQDVKSAAVDFFLSAGGGFVSPGHCSRIVTDDKGQEWIFYHAFVQGEQDKGRRLMMSNVTWSNGWPVIEGGVPVKESKKVPSFN